MMASTQRQLTTFILGCFKGFKLVCWGEPPVPNKLLCQLFLTSSTSFWLESSRGAGAQAFASISREGKGKTGIRTSGIGKKAQQSDCVIKIEQSIIVRSKFEQTKHITYSKKYQEKNMSTPTAMIKVYELFITWQILFKPWFRVWDFQRFFDVFFVVLVELVKASGRACIRTLHLRRKHRWFTAPASSVIFWWVSSIIITLSQGIARTKHLI